MNDGAAKFVEQGPKVKTQLLRSKGAVATMAPETGRTVDMVAALAGGVHDHANPAASVSSGSLPVCGMLPPAPSLYHGPYASMAVVGQTAGQALDQFDIPPDLFRRRGGHDA